MTWIPGERPPCGKPGWYATLNWYDYETPDARYWDGEAWQPERDGYTVIAFLPEPHVDETAAKTAAERHFHEW